MGNRAAEKWAIQNLKNNKVKPSKGKAVDSLYELYNEANKEIEELVAKARKRKKGKLTQAEAKVNEENKAKAEKLRKLIILAEDAWNKGEAFSYKWEGEEVKVTRSTSYVII